MKKCMKSIMALMLCVIWVSCAQAQDPNDPNNQEEATVKIVLTKFDVNDTRLELGWKIRNDSDHDVWICDSANLRSTTGGYETFLDEDAYTLIIRRRFDLSDEYGMREFPLKGRYVPLRVGEELTGLCSYSIPIRPVTLFESERANAEFAGLIVMEIGFYDENLPELILRIVDVADRLGCDFRMGVVGGNIDIFDRFFSGWAVQKTFYHDNGNPLRETVEAGEEVLIPYMRKVLHGEKVLRLEINSLSIPYQGNIPLTSNRGQKAKEKQTQQVKSNDKEQTYKG